MAKNNSSQSPGLAGEFVGADASLRQLRLLVHLIFLLLMFLLPALFGRFLFLSFTYPLAHRLGIHPAVSSALLVNVLTPAATDQRRGVERTRSNPVSSEQSLSGPDLRRRIVPNHERRAFGKFVSWDLPR